MTVRVNKSGFNIREKLSELERPIGLKGSELMRAETAQEARDFVSAGRKNLIINGGFDVWQRGTTQSTSTYGSADRWFCWGANSTFSRSTNVPSQSGFTYSIETSGTPTGEYIIAQAIELPGSGNAGVFYNGQIITISYYAKSSVNGDTLRDFIGFRDVISSSTNQSVVHNDQSIFHKLTTNWKRYERTYTIGVSPSGTNTSLVIMPRSTSTPSGNISITGVQLEVGKNATEFEHRSYGEELALCQRYYEKWSGTAGSVAWYTAHGYGDRIYALLPYKVSKRTSPSGVGASVEYSTTNANALFWAYGNTNTGSDIGALMTSTPIITSSTNTDLSFYIQLSASTYTPYGTAVVWAIKNGEWIAINSEL